MLGVKAVPGKEDQSKPVGKANAKCFRSRRQRRGDHEWSRERRTRSGTARTRDEGYFGREGHPDWGPKSAEG